MEHKFSETEADTKIRQCIKETIEKHPAGIPTDEYLKMVNTVIYLHLSWLLYHNKPIRGDASGDYWITVLCDSVNDYLEEHFLPLVDNQYMIEKASGFVPL